ncbi:MAG: Na+/H+ antiporter subunit D [Ancrocorticia sp.]|nr:Na+/H+ antiporter subunit D [Ancrocorticia sp.]MCI1895878.1 Na+/H+ antiporter subunit D [Ancrocorticia sp.]MCI1932537.1 Na+/H+ antiporter subunit D [Ancrocorticia sp.]MCI1963711.1 Na+/H+ antiporter subunit D [Ancrocorticia sp.]MCI2003048.1 Na+/H+ antiporter subunit D [Ancrocorticia sp.]
MSLNVLLAMPILLPLGGAGVLLAFKNRRLQAVVTIVLFSLVLASAVLLLIASLNQPLVLAVGNWAAPIGIVLVADRLSSLMLVTSVTVTFLVLIYSIFQGVADGDRAAPTAIYYPAFLILSAGVSDAFLSGDLFNIYVGFEILLAASFVLITMGGTMERMRTGTVYVIVSLVSSAIFLTAIGLIYAACGTVNLAQLAVRLTEVDPGLRLMLQMMLLIGFGIKAAIFPLSAWLPDSYPTASAPVTAVFAGLLTKVGIYAIIRTQVLLFPGGRLDSVLAVVAIATMLIGILGAVAQQDIKRLLSFTLVSHMGYMVWGISLTSQNGLSSTIFYAVHHITVQTALFLVVGLIERRGGTTSLIKLGSLGKAAPMIAALYLIPALNLAGVPPLSGFLGKIGLMQASASRGTAMDWALIAAGIVTSLLTLYAVIRVWVMAFWQVAPEKLEERACPNGMMGAAGALVALSLMLTVIANPLRTFTDDAARQLRERSTYVTAVLQESGYRVGVPEDIEGVVRGE